MTAELNTKYDTHIVIDTLFLNKAIFRAKAEYSEIYPGREFQEVNLEKIITGLSRFLKIEGATKIIILKTAFSKPTFYAGEKTIETESGLIIIDCKTVEFITFGLDDCADDGEVFKEIILFADDIGYIPVISSFKKQGIKFNLVRYSNDATTMIDNETSTIRWLDVSYVVRIAMGLEQGEL
jgi:hypothetical protein